MATRLSLLCERIVEAGWLGALVITPLLFDVHSDNSFELDKAMTLRSLALLMIAAWIVRAIDGWRATSADEPRAESRRRSAGPRWWRILGLSFLVAHAVATAVSVAPRLSLWGSLTRAQGLYTTGAYLVVYLSLLAGLRRPEQMERLISTALVASFPVSLYGIIQHFGTDPVSWSQDVTVRVTSTLGNPIFAAAFLSMLVPLTLYRHFDSGRRIVETEGTGVRRALVIGGLLGLMLQVAGWWLGPKIGSLLAVTTLGMWSVQGWLLRKPVLPFVRVGVYSVLLSAQLACLLLSQSRGPWIGLAAGLGLFALLHGLARGAWRRVALTTGLGLATILVLVWMNVPGSPISSRELPYLDRLSGMLRATGRVRLLIWGAVDERIRHDPTRAIIGYGPETLRLVSAPFIPSALGQIERRGALPDRAHNELLDAVAMTGFFGGAVYLLLFTSLALWTLPSLGVAHSPRQRRTLLGLWLGGGLAGAALSGLVAPSGGFWGPGIPLGMLGGLGVYLITNAITTAFWSRAYTAAPWTASELLRAILLSALVVHFVETQFGIAVTATRTYFWTYAAVLVCTRRIHETGREHREMDDRDERPRVTGISLVVALVLTTLTYGFVSGETGTAQLPSIGWLFGLTWLFGGLVCLTGSQSARGAVGTMGIYSAITLGFVTAFAVAHVGWLRWLGEEQKANAPVSFIILLLLTVAAIGAALARAETLPSRRMTLPAILALPVVVAATGIVAMGNLDAIRADIAFKQARFAALLLGREDRAIGWLRRAVELEPTRRAYRGLHGELLTRKAQLAAEREKREALFREAEKTLRDVEETSPLDPDSPARLARLYATWALGTSDAERREERFQASLAHYEKALERFPGNVLLWNESAALHVSMGDRAGAVEIYQHSLALDGRFAETYLQLGDLYQLDGDWNKAAEAYEQAVERNPGSLRAHHALARAFTRTGRLEDAIRAYEGSITHHPNDPRSHQELARLYFSTGKFDRAKVHGEQALTHAPPRERPAIERFLAQVERALSTSR